MDDYFPIMPFNVTIDALQNARAQYAQGLAAIDQRRTQLRAEDEKLARDRLATVGALQAIERLLAPAPEAKAAAPVVGEGVAPATPGETGRASVS